MVTMDLEARDVIAIVSVLVAFGSMLVVSRNARRATSVNAQNLDLARIRDLRVELRETKEDLDKARVQVTDLNQQLVSLNQRVVEANEAAMAAYRERAEMLRWAHMPGMSIDAWLDRFDAPPESIGGRIDP